MNPLETKAWQLVMSHPGLTDAGIDSQRQICGELRQPEPRVAKGPKPRSVLTGSRNAKLQAPGRTNPQFILKVDSFLKAVMI